MTDAENREFTAALQLVVKTILQMASSESTKSIDELDVDPEEEQERIRIEREHGGLWPQSYVMERLEVTRSRDLDNQINRGYAPRPVPADKNGGRRRYWNPADFVAWEAWRAQKPCRAKFRRWSKSGDNRFWEVDGEDGSTFES